MSSFMSSPPSRDESLLYHTPPSTLPGSDNNATPGNLISFNTPPSIIGRRRDQIIPPTKRLDHEDEGSGLVHVAQFQSDSIFSPLPQPPRINAEDEEGRAHIAQFQRDSIFSPIAQPNFEERQETSENIRQVSVSPQGDNFQDQVSPLVIAKPLERNGLIPFEERLKEAVAAKEREMEAKFQQKQAEIDELLAQVARLEESRAEEDSLGRVLAEYEKTMSGYIQQIDELREKLEGADSDKLKIIRERDLALEDLRNVENAFSDVHRKYERAKGVLENFKTNEETLKKRDQEMLEKIAHRDFRLEQLKEKTQASLQLMHQNYEGRIKELEMEANRQRVLIRKADLKMETLKNDVAHKEREINKLSGLCDELIGGSCH